ncbi:MAG: hypothetical protein ABJ024_12705, partial [Lentilitoribacter sp.]
MRIVTLLLMTLLSYQFLATPFTRADDSGVKHYDCGTFAEPIVEIAYGSRYTDESVTRADYDEASNAEVNKVLKPIDDFARTLVVLSNNAIRLESKTEKNTFCVVDMIYQWAKADALSVQETINVKMSIPARYGSIATALAQLDVQGDLRFMQKNLVIQQWLERRAFETIYFFDNEAPGG